MTLEVPTLTGLDPSQPDYVSKLEEGLDQVDRAAREVFTTSLPDAAELTRKLEAAGIQVETLPPTRHETKTGESSLIDTLSSYIITAQGIPQIRQMEDIQRSYIRRLEDAVRNQEDQMRIVNRAAEDFQKALLALTHIQPLADPNYANPEAHLYVPRQEGVYELHMDLASANVIGPQLNPRLPLDVFSGGLDGLKEYSDAATAEKTNAYIVTNPSQRPPLGILLSHALIQIHTERAENLRKREAARTPLNRFLDGIRGAGKLFSRFRGE